MVIIKVKYGSKEYANGLFNAEYKMTTQADAEALMTAIEDAQGYLEYEITGIKEKNYV